MLIPAERSDEGAGGGLAFEGVGGEDDLQQCTCADGFTEKFFRDEFAEGGRWEMTRGGGTKQSVHPRSVCTTGENIHASIGLERGEYTIQSGGGFAAGDETFAGMGGDFAATTIVSQQYGCRALSEQRAFSRTREPPVAMRFDERPVEFLGSDY